MPLMSRSSPAPKDTDSENPLLSTPSFSSSIFQPPRKKGKSINYRHIIDSLVRKPGAFANYQYREEMFPTSQFRIAYDILREAHSEKVADKIYVQILELAARQSEEQLQNAVKAISFTTTS